MSVLEKLRVFDDPLFSFNEKYHRYAYDGTPLISVTKYISNFHLPFDKEAISKKTAASTGQTQEQVLEQWKTKNERSILVGHTVHNYIENYFKGIYQPLPADIGIISRINSFNIAWGKYLHKLQPIAFEKKIFHKDWGLAGTMDALFYYNDKVIILDYKSNEEFRDDTHPKGCYNKLLPPFDTYFQNHMSEYSIQVSLYSLILKEVADIDVEKCFLLHIGNEGPKMYTAHDFRDKLKEHFKK